MYGKTTQNLKQVTQFATWGGLSQQQQHAHRLINLIGCQKLNRREEGGPFLQHGLWLAVVPEAVS